jgi:hypothetical protein
MCNLMMALVRWDFTITKEFLIMDTPYLFMFSIYIMLLLINSFNSLIHKGATSTTV